jgi:hypothetical protein
MSLRRNKPLRRVLSPPSAIAASLVEVINT